MSVRAELIIPREELKNKIQDRIQKGLELSQVNISSIQNYDDIKSKYYKWTEFNTELLKRSFTGDEFVSEYNPPFFGMSGLYNESLSEKIIDLRDNIKGKIRRLESLMERLELIPLSPEIDILNEANIPSPAKSKKIFIVHGRDEVAKTSLEVFLHEIGLNPVVLHRQADQGQTVIEKIEANSDVGFAFILLTPDEVAYLSAEDVLPDAERNKEFRARPNVMFEFGYFIGKLGRSKVCCLYTGNVSIPSDLNGFIYKKYNSNIDEVAYSIIKDLKATGYDI